jgi:spore germination protein GerM
MNKQTIAVIAVLIIIIALGVVFINGQNRTTVPQEQTNQPATNTPVTTTPNPTQETQTISVYFTDSKSPEFETSCAASTKVTRTIAKTQSVADAALKELFKGPTASEKNRGLEDLFHMENESALSSSYIGVTVNNGVAVVNFKEAGLRYLSSPACMQASIKSSIENTLKQFSTIKKVEYAINGEIYTEWDA